MKKNFPLHPKNQKKEKDYIKEKRKLMKIIKKIHYIYLKTVKQQKKIEIMRMKKNQMIILMIRN